MAPPILYRVCYGNSKPESWQSRLLTIKPAILHDFCRYKVRYCDYPAIIPQANSAVRGTLVTGLTEGDMYRLDIFEGDDYTRQKVKVRVLAKVGDNSRERSVGPDEVETETYVWTSEEDELEYVEWDFEEFARENTAWWIGIDKEYEVVDKAMQPEPVGGEELDGNMTGS